MTRQSGAIRAAILHRFGGLYLDIDVSCLRPSTDMLAGADVVLQVGLPAEVQCRRGCRVRA